MKLTEICIRFYKSFNYDFLRKHHPDGEPQPWEMIDTKWYPYVRINIDQNITTIVGANESGKSHLLSAIEKGLTGKNIDRSDFCRYSHFFTVEKDKRRWSDFGLRWSHLSDDESSQVSDILGIEDTTKIEHFYVFRNTPSSVTVYCLLQDKYEKFSIEGENQSTLFDILPTSFRIDSNIALPSSVPIQALISDKDVTSGIYANLERRNRVALTEQISHHLPSFGDAKTITANAPKIFSVFSKYLSPPASDADTALAELKRKQYKLACDLIYKVAGIDTEVIKELYNAIRDSNDGHVNALVDRINESLEKRLNFPKWWVQDREFALKITPREHELVFTIEDRTKTEYAFSERSSGLKYFLSYYIQYLSHQPESSQSEILLMDEPDAYLSSQAQQDLLKIFHAFAQPASPGVKPIQVVFVTHSPFLIDKNHADRIRVLEKGAVDEGTRVIRNASRNHYEPLRSAFGAFVGETAFIGNCNLVVEGTADQVIIAGATMLLRREGVGGMKALDLNHLTIVPAGSANHIPYLVYLAIGRDYEKPAVVVLLDSDSSGLDAETMLLGRAPLKKQRLSKHYILRIDELSDEIGSVPSQAPKMIEIEDLVPLHIAVNAAKNYFHEFAPDLSTETASLTEEMVSSQYAEGVSVFDALTSALSALNADARLDKIGLARHIVTYATDLPNDHPALKEFINTFTLFSERISRMQRKAVQERRQEGASQRITRLRKAFFQDNPDTSTKEEAALLIEDIDNALDSSDQSDTIRLLLDTTRRKFKLNDDQLDQLDDFDDFKDHIERIQYSDKLSAEGVEPAPEN